MGSIISFSSDLELGGRSCDFAANKIGFEFADYRKLDTKPGAGSPAQTSTKASREEDKTR